MITKQSTLNNFFDLLPAARPLHLDKALEWELEPHVVDPRYKVIERKHHVIEIEEMHCKDCGSLLYYNGYNQKHPVLDKMIGKRRYHVHRKRCPRCGEITPDYSALAPPHKQYHENYRRRARWHFINGLNPIQIKRAFKVDLGVDIPRSTIRDWVSSMKKPIRNVLSSTYYPMTGHWQHDETYLAIRGKEHYALVTLDAGTGFALSVTVASNNGKKEAKEHLLGIKRRHLQMIQSIMADGTNKFGTLFRKRSFKKAKRAQCLMHFKWRTCRKLKRLAGFGESSIKKLPEKFRSFRQAFYDVFDSHDLTSAYIALEKLRDLVVKANKRYLTVLFNDIESKLESIMHWQRQPLIPRTNNKVENFHQQLQYHTSFTSRCRSMEAAQFIMDARTFNFNFQRYDDYLKKIRRLKNENARHVAVKPYDPSLYGCAVWLFHERKRTLQSFEKYKAFWREYLEIK